MIDFDEMTAMAPAGLARTTMHVREGAPWNVASFPFDEQKCGRSFDPGGAR